jgi:hypothetical protein
VVAQRDLGRTQLLGHAYRMPRRRREHSEQVVLPGAIFSLTML